MADLMRWNPMRDIARLSWEMDRFIQDFMGTPVSMEANDDCSPPLESFQRNGSFVVRVELPGVNPKDVNLKAEEGSLTIEGERRRDENIPEDSFTRKELWYGQFKRTVPMPAGVKTDEIKAKYRDGILEITAPVDERYLPQRVQIEVQSN